MSQSLAFLGLLLALAGQPVLLALLKRFGVDTLGVPARLSLWVLTGIICLVFLQDRHWRVDVGLPEPIWRAFELAALAIVLSFAGASVIHLLQQRRSRGSAGLPPVSSAPDNFGPGGAQPRPRSEAGAETTEQFRKIAALSLPQKVLLVLTAGVTEELLYRAVAIGFGSQLLGSLWLAVALSLAAFTLGHLRWGSGHLLPVLWAGAVMSGLFILSGSIAACVGAHVLIDAVGVIAAPALLAKREHRGAVQRTA